MAWEMQISSGAWVDAPFKPPVKIEEGKKATFTFQNIPCTLEFKSTTEAVVTAKDKTYMARPKALQALDSHEEERKISQKRVSAQARSEQLRIVSEMEHAEHEAKEERKSNRKSAIDAMEEERKSQMAEHGEAVRKVPSRPCSQQLADVVPKDWQDSTATVPEPEAVKLEALDSHEEERKISQRRASSQVKSEQLRILAEMEHAEHEAKEERKSNRKSALEAMEAERKSQLSEHGDSVRKVPSKPDPEQLADVVPKDWQDSVHTVH